MMGIAEKIAGAKNATWLTEGLSDPELRTIVELAKISARIEKSRLDLGMTQAEFAAYMGVSQSMVSKWESREYNFTIRTLNEICQKLHLELLVNVGSVCEKNDYKIIKWDNEVITNSRNDYKWLNRLPEEEAIA